jgi:hypothetical protein
VKISGDLLSNPLCEQDQAFLESMTALDTAMKRMDSFNQEKVGVSTCPCFSHTASHHSRVILLDCILSGVHRNCLLKPK